MMPGLPGLNYEFVIGRRQIDREARGCPVSETAMSFAGNGGVG
jgi:hypothetical protein